MIAGIPYDAEVEYLESTGTQWIDTGVVPGGKRISAIIGFRYVSTTYDSNNNKTPNILASWKTDGTDDFRAVAIFQNHWRFKIAGTNVSYGTADTAFHVIKANTESGTMLDGVVVPGLETQKTIPSTNQNSIWIFGAHTSPSVYKLLSKACVYYCLITDNNTLVRSFIPVRVGNVGYMYDRVTRRLYGNAGSGAFVLGPDVARPVMGIHRMASASVGGADFGKIGATPTVKRWTARDYVQSGLVAMWDGVENAGWGVHDPDANVNGLVNLVAQDDPKVIGSTTAKTTVGVDFFQYGQLSDNSGIGYLYSTKSYDPVFAEAVIEVPDTGWFRGKSNDAVNCQVLVSSDNAFALSLRLSMRAASTGDSNIYVPIFYNGSSGAIKLAPGKHSVSVYWGNVGYVDGVQSESVSASGTSAVYNYTKGTRLVSTNAGGDLGYGLKAYCVRLYNIAPTAAEIARNHRIDQLRFNLP